MADDHAPGTLRATVIVDYQNVHLVAHNLFAASRHRPLHESLVDPLNFADQLIQARNQAQRAGHPLGTDYSTVGYA